MSDEYKATFYIERSSGLLTQSQIEEALDDNLGDIWDDFYCDVKPSLTIPGRMNIECSGKMHLPSGDPNTPVIKVIGKQFYNNIKDAIINGIGPAKVAACFTNLDHCDYTFP
jgi:hypothetical protein